MPEDALPKARPITDHRLPAAVDAPCFSLQSATAGQLSYYADTTAAGRPLVLLHSINAAPSAREMQPLFEHYRTSRPVYALELPGYGRSERSDRPYTIDLFTAAVTEFLDTVVGEPADVVAFSLSAEFAARAVVNGSPHIRSLALLSPTGLGHREPPGEKFGRRMLGVLRAPLLGDSLFSMLTTKPSIRYFTGLSFDGPAPRALTDYAHATSHQPGAKYAPTCFLSMQLFTPNAVDTLYRKVELPVLVVYDRDPNVSFERLDELTRDCPNWRAVRIAPTRGIPHWQRPDDTIRALDDFWSGIDRA